MFCLYHFRAKIHDALYTPIDKNLGDSASKGEEKDPANFQILTSNSIMIFNCFKQTLLTKKAALTSITAVWTSSFWTTKFCSQS